MDECKNRGAVLDGKKCFCVVWDRWTNCLEVGHCVRESVSGEPATDSEDDWTQNERETFGRRGTAALCA